MFWALFEISNWDTDLSFITLSSCYEGGANLDYEYELFILSCLYSGNWWVLRWLLV